MKLQRTSWLHRVALGMLIVVGFSPWVLSAGAVTPTNVTGSANHLGDGTTDRAQIQLAGKFTAALGAIAACTVTIDDVLFDVNADPPVESVDGVSGVVLSARSGSSATAAIFERSGRPSFRMELKTRGGNTFEFNLKIERATIPEAPETETIPPGPGDPAPVVVANLQTSFTVKCPNAVVEVTTTRLWRQRDFPPDPISFRTP